MLFRVSETESGPNRQRGRESPKSSHSDLQRPKRTKGVGVVAFLEALRPRPRGQFHSCFREIEVGGVIEVCVCWIRRVHRFPQGCVLAALVEGTVRAPWSTDTPIGNPSHLAMPIERKRREPGTDSFLRDSLDEQV